MMQRGGQSGLWKIGLAGLLLLAGCGGDSAPSSQSGSDGGRPFQGVTDTELVLGAHTDLSGPIAIWGVESMNGLRMRFEEANKAGGVHGRQIRFVVEDTQYQVPKAISAGNKLINRDKIFAMVLALGTQTNNAVLTQQLEAGVPNLFPVTGARSMNEPYHDLKFTQRGIYYDEVQAAVAYFINERGKQSPCVIHHDSEYGAEIYDAVADQLASMEMSIVASSAHKPTETEFTASILKLRNAECDVVFLATVHRDSILIFETARKLGWDDVDFVGQNAAYGKVIAEVASGASEGYYCFAHLAAPYIEDDLPAAARAWWNKYEAKYGQAPDIVAMESYRAADLVVLALENAGRELTMDGFIAGMEAITDYTDLFGYKVSFGPGDHQGVSESVLSIVRDGRWQTVEQSVSY